MSLSSHQSARMKNDEWLTPREILGELGAFDLDPCSPVVRPWATAAEHYTIADDGLSLPWIGRVWLNPPFGSEAVKWLRRLVEHGNGIALIPARTETRMFYECVWDVAAAVCFMRGRPHFHYVDGTRAKANSGAPICLVAYGQFNAAQTETEWAWKGGAGMTCAACTAAESEPLRHDYTNGCESCQARAIAQVGSHHESVEAGRVTDRMKEQLQKFFPADPAKGWISVREWGVKVDRARKQKCN